MAKEQTVAPRERVNITYKPATGDAKEEVELPLKLVMLGDYTLREDERTLEERDPVNIDKDNFDSVMKEQRLELTFTVPDRLSGEEDAEVPVNLRFENIKDFTPEMIAEQVPELGNLLELRKALQALKGPLGNLPAFRKKLQGLMDSEADVDRLLAELGTGEAAGEE